MRFKGSLLTLHTSFAGHLGGLVHLRCLVEELGSGVSEATQDGSQALSMAAHINREIYFLFKVNW
jgi:hypothetical protein